MSSPTNRKSAPALMSRAGAELFELSLMLRESPQGQIGGKWEESVSCNYTHSWWGAPVFVSSVRTKNMKMTKTASPTQKPITMESEMSKKMMLERIALMVEPTSASPSAPVIWIPLRGGTSPQLLCQSEQSVFSKNLRGLFVWCFCLIICLADYCWEY